MTISTPVGEIQGGESFVNVSQPASTRQVEPAQERLVQVNSGTNQLKNWSKAVAAFIYKDAPLPKCRVLAILIRST